MTAVTQIRHEKIGTGSGPALRQRNKKVFFVVTNEQHFCQPGGDVDQVFV
ncbi:MAG: hypothetical protein GY861_19915 [bacterium]|nr:hypothetical protein [bacterium]